MCDITVIDQFQNVSQRLNTGEKGGLAGLATQRKHLDNIVHSALQIISPSSLTSVCPALSDKVWKFPETLNLSASVTSPQGKKTVTVLIVKPSYWISSERTRTVNWQSSLTEVFYKFSTLSWSAAWFLGCIVCALNLHPEVLMVIFNVLVLVLVWLATQRKLNWFNWL